jgi:hypothetical protein
MMRTTMNPITEYAAGQEAARQLLDQIREALDAHATTAKPHWGHVGDVGHVETNLTEILAFLRGENH